MNLDRHTKNKELISALRMAMYDFSESTVRKVLDELFISEPVLSESHGVVKNNKMNTE